MPNVLKPWLLASGAFLVIAVIAAATYFRGREYHIVVTQTQIEAELKNRFPIRKNHLGLVEITWTDPVIQFLPSDNRVKMGLRAETRIQVLRNDPLLGAACQISAGIKYAPRSRQFYLVQPKLESVDLKGVPAEWETRTRTALTAGLPELGDRPIHQIKPQGWKTILAWLLLKEVRVAQQELHVVIGL